MVQDTATRPPGGTGAGGVVERADERRAERTSGATGGAGGLWGSVVVGATGAAVLAIGIAGTRSVLVAVPHPPWVGMALYALVVGGAIAAMWLAAAQVATGPRHGAIAAGGARPGSTQPAGPAQAAGPAAPAAAPLERFQVETREGRRVVAADAVEWFEASGNYSRLHLADASYLHRLPLVRLERELDGRRFLRVHRSAIVNLDAIRGVEPLPSGDAELRLASGARVRLSRRYARVFHERTGRGR